MGFYDKYPPVETWKWKHFQTKKPYDIYEFIDRYPNAEFWIGTDSQNKGSKCTFATCLVAYTMRKGGNAILALDKTESISNLRQRLMVETMRSLELAWHLEDKLEGRHLSIHLDVNSDKMHDSGRYKDELVGFVTAQGFDCKNKPHAPAASWAADKVVKR